MSEKVTLTISDNWSIKVCPDWARIIAPLIETKSFKSLLASSLSSNLLVPERKQVFRAFELVDFKDVRVTIVGQDPYPSYEHASGLAFGVPVTSSVPRTLINIVNEIERDANSSYWDGTKVIVPPPTQLQRQWLTLEGWAQQGVLLLNSVLTTEEQTAGAHIGKGWEEFTDAIVYSLTQRRAPMVFMLWGTLAQRKQEILDADRFGGQHSYILTLKASHPSPSTFSSGMYGTRFCGCEHFSKANVFFAKSSLPKIDWARFLPIKKKEKV